MNADSWKPTAVLAYSALGTVMQRWTRECSDYRQYNGELRPRRTTWIEYEWRQLPPIASFHQPKQPGSEGEKHGM